MATGNPLKPFSDNTLHDNAAVLADRAVAPPPKSFRGH
jgi:hypothetical protein